MKEDHQEILIEVFQARFQIVAHGRGLFMNAHFGNHAGRGGDHDGRGLLRGRRRFALCGLGGLLLLQRGFGL